MTLSVLPACSPSLLPCIELSSLESSLIGAPLESRSTPQAVSITARSAQSSKRLFPKTPINRNQPSTQKHKGWKRRLPWFFVTNLLNFAPLFRLLNYPIRLLDYPKTCTYLVDTLGYNEPNTTYAPLPWFHTIGLGLARSPPTPTGVGLEHPSPSVWVTQLTTDSQCSRSLRICTAAAKLMPCCTRHTECEKPAQYIYICKLSSDLSFFRS